MKYVKIETLEELTKFIDYYKNIFKGYADANSTLSNYYNHKQRPRYCTPMNLGFDKNDITHLELNHYDAKQRAQIVEEYSYFIDGAITLEQLLNPKLYPECHI